MRRRDSLKVLAASTGTMLMVKKSLAWAAEKKGQSSAKPHDHNESGNKDKQPQTMGGMPTLKVGNEAASHCSHAAQMCVGHCLIPISQGQKEMVECAQSALEVVALSDALSRLAGLGSQLCTVLAKACMAACETCVKACEPHVDYHSQCKECFEACKDCLETCKAYAALQGPRESKHSF